MRDTPCSQDGILQWLTATFFLWFILAIYFDNVLPDVNGVGKSWFYFLKTSYWTGKASNQVEGNMDFFFFSDCNFLFTDVVLVSRANDTYLGYASLKHI
jgi:hypothetical protein